MNERGRGRPGKASGELDRARIEAAALALVTKDGLRGLTMRRLAGDLGVTAMALYPHVGSRATLIASLVDRLFPNPPEGTTVQVLLNEYVSRIMRQPGLLLAIFDGTVPMPDTARRFTDRLADMLGDREMAHVVIDHAHGFALSLSLGGDTAHASDTYARALARLVSSHHVDFTLSPR